MAALLERDPAGSIGPGRWRRPAATARWSRSPGPTSTGGATRSTRSHATTSSTIPTACSSPGSPRAPRCGRIGTTGLTASYTRTVLAISVLGPVEVRRDDRLVTVPAGKTSELLVRLALDAGTVVTADRLVDDLWGADAVNTRRNTLQSKIVKLRRALGDPAVVVSGDGGYRLASTASRCRRPARAGAAGGGAALVERGRRCRRGRAVRVDPPALPRRTAGRRRRRRLGWCRIARGWRRRTLQLIETECAARLRLGQLGEVIGDLETAVLAVPVPGEPLGAADHGALSGRSAGRRAGRYQRVRALLADELGLEPGPQLRQRRGAGARAAIRSLERRRSAQPWPSVADAPVGNLPTMMADLVGRDAELSTVGDLVAEHPLVELVGPGGSARRRSRSRSARADRAPGGAWLARLETTTTADEVVDAVIAALGVTGGDGSLFERLKTADTLLVLDNCEHVLDAAADLVQRIARRRRRGRGSCAPRQAPLGIDGEVVVELEPLALADAVELFTRRASLRNAATQALDGADDSVRDAVPLARRAAARDRAGGGADEDAVDRRDRPPARRPVRPAQRPHQPPTRASAGAAGDDRLELRAAVPRRPARPVGAGHVRRRSDAARASSTCCRRSTCRRAPRSTCVGRLASRSLLIVDDDTGSAPTRYRLLDSIRAFALEAMDRCRARPTRRTPRTPAGSPSSPARSTDGTRSADQADHLAVARAERANVDAALELVRRQRPAARRDDRERIRLGLGRARRQPWRAAHPHRARRGRRSGAPCTTGRRVCCSPAGSRPRSATSSRARRAHRRGGGAGGRDRRRRAAGPQRVLPRLRRVARRRLPGRPRADRPQPRAVRRARPPVGPRRQRAVRHQGGDLGRRRGARGRGRASTPAAALATVDDPWMHVRFEAMLGELARLQRRFDDAVDHLGRAAATSHRLGFLQTEAYQVASLGRAQCQAGDYEHGRGDAEHRDRQGRGHRRRADGGARQGPPRPGAALRSAIRPGARIALEQAVAWQRAAGGGEQAVLGECLLAALEACDGAADAAGAARRAPRARPTRRTTHRASVFALDALARLAIDSGDGDRAAASCPIVPTSGWRTRRTSSQHAIASTPSTPGTACRPDTPARSASALRALRPLRRLSAVKPSSPPTATTMPTPCPPLIRSPSSRNDHTTASTGWITCVMPIVPMATVRWANTISPCAATPVRTVSTSVYVQPVRLRPNTSPFAIASGSTATAAIGLTVAMKVGDVHVAPEVARRHHVADPQHHGEQPEHVAAGRGVAARRRAEQHDGQPAEGDEREHERSRVDRFVEQPGSDRHDQERRERPDQRGVGHAVVRRPDEERGEVEPEEHAGHERLPNVRAS